jgi:type II secretory pathway pseudopilin PulG
MLVIAIISILSAVVYPMMTGALSSARDGATRGNLGVIRSALAIYYGDTEGQYPQFAAPYDGHDTGYGPILANALVPKYLVEMPKASEWNTPHPISNQVFQIWNQTGDEDGPGWKYDANPFDLGVYAGYAGFGSLKVLCTHKDAKGVNWSTY